MLKLLLSNNRKLVPATERLAKFLTCRQNPARQNGERSVEGFGMAQRGYDRLFLRYIDSHFLSFVMRVELGMTAQTGKLSRLEPFDKRALLRAHPFFRSWGDLIIEQLAPRAVARKVRKGAVLFRKGDIGSRLYVVCSGAVKVSAPSEEGKDAIFNVIVPGEIFGEIAFLDGGERTADAIMIDGGELMMIERRDFIPLLRDHPDIAISLIEILCGRLRRTSEQVEDIVFLDAEARLAKVLLHLHRRGSGAARRKIEVTQRELSQMIGVSRESANKQLRSLQRRKYLALERGGIVVLAPEALENLFVRREMRSMA